MWRLGPVRVTVFIAIGVLAALLLVWVGLRNKDRSAPADSPLVEELEAADTGNREPLSDDKRKISDAERAQLLKRAQVWRQPRVAIDQASLVGETLDEVRCKFNVSDLGGTTPKFDCHLDSGEEIRIKYGNGPEVPAEAAATLLMRVLGFGADEVKLVRTLRCYGCPKEPFSTMKAVGITRTDGLYERIVDYDKYEVFEWVGLERKFNARPVETDTLEGWAFFELDALDPAAGGAPRSHVDALRLMAVLLAHWDNKAENQRLVCLSRVWNEGTPCSRPFLLLQDLGATFGPSKVDLEAWARTPIWEDRATCTVSMRSLPFEGATFGQVRISEAGRQFAASLLAALSEQQLTELFTYARFQEKRGLFTPTHAVSEWVSAFTSKVREISGGPPCPDSAP